MTGFKVTSSVLPSPQFFAIASGDLLSLEQELDFDTSSVAFLVGGLGNFSVAALFLTKLARALLCGAAILVTLIKTC